MTITTTTTVHFVLLFLGYYGQDLMRPGALHLVFLNKLNIFIYYYYYFYFYFIIFK